MAAITCPDLSAGEPARVPPAPRMLPDLATLDDQELLGIARSLPPASQRRVSCWSSVTGAWCGCACSDTGAAPSRPRT